MSAPDMPGYARLLRDMPFPFRKDSTDRTLSTGVERVFMVMGLYRSQPRTATEAARPEIPC